MTSERIISDVEIDVTDNKPFIMFSVLDREKRQNTKTRY